MRQQVWGILLLACIMLAFGVVAAPEQAQAQIGCPAANGADAPAGEITGIAVINDSCFVRDPPINSYADVNVPVGGEPTSFSLFLPGGDLSADGNPVKFAASNTANNNNGLSRKMVH